MTDRLASTPTVLRFRDIEVDVRTGTLRRNGQRSTLSDQPLHLLTALLERPGELVTRDELRRRLWPADTYVDFEHGLNAAIKRLRDALGDSADAPTYIETVPRRGYRLVLPVAAPAHEDAAAAQSLDTEQGEPVQEPRSTSHRDWRRWLVVVIFLTGALGLWWAIWSTGRAARNSPDPGRIVQRELKRLTLDAGLQTDVTWSPDGGRIAYASDKSGNLDIWVQEASGGDPIPIAMSDAPDTQPTWAPKGDQIVFRSERDGGGLFLASARGGPARRLTSFGMRPAWTPSGREVLFSTGESGSSQKLYAVCPTARLPRASCWLPSSKAAAGTGSARARMDE